MEARTLILHFLKQVVSHPMILIYIGDSIANPINTEPAKHLPESDGQLGHFARMFDARRAASNRHGTSRGRHRG